MTKPIDISEYLREYHERGEIVLMARWAMDGAETLAEAAQLLRMFADELVALGHARSHLMGPVEDDYGLAHRGDKDTPEEPPALPQKDRSMRQLNEDAPARAPEAILGP